VSVTNTYPSLYQDEELIDQLMGMGVCSNRDDARRALEAGGGSVARAVELIFSNTTIQESSTSTALIVRAQHIFPISLLLKVVG
jgi:hypothetical protein